MFVGEAPGANEDKLGTSVRRSGRPAARDSCSARSAWRAGTSSSPTCSSAVRRATAIRCPSRSTTAASTCSRQLDLIEPKVVCTLGNFATKLLRKDPTGITRLRGQAEIRTIGDRTVRLYPLLHPAAALYTRSNVELLREDFARIPALLALPAPAQPDRPENAPERIAAAEPPPAGAAAPSEQRQPSETARDDQLDLFGGPG